MLWSVSGHLKCAIPSVVSFKVANTDVYPILQSTKDILQFVLLPHENDGMK